MNKIINIFKIPKNYLTLLAGTVWMFAGFMVSSIGIPALLKHISLLSLLFFSIFFLIFYWVIFRKSVYKHIDRIRDRLDDTTFLWNFFDIPSYIIMFIMIFGGTMLRKSELIPENIIGALYSGIGLALFSCGLRYIFAFFRKYVLMKK
jgi:hypothetical protein